MAFSQKERERTQKRVIQELPERASLFGSPEALQDAKRRGYITLVVGLTLLVAWFFVFGKIFV